jgi:hypothetical protein
LLAIRSLEFEVVSDTHEFNFKTLKKSYLKMESNWLVSNQLKQKSM